MANNKINLCYILTVLHLLLLNSQPLSQSSNIRSLLYILSYALPVIILLFAFPVKIIKTPRINVSDILILFPSMVVASYMITLFSGPPSASYVLTPYTFVMTGILGPVCEELFWRGSIFRVLQKFGFIPAALISSFFFALMHKGVGGIIYAMFSGIIFSYLTYSSGSTLGAIILHVINNTAALILPTDSLLILTIVLVSIITGVLIKVLVPTKQTRTGGGHSQRGAFRMPYLYVTALIFITFKLLEAYLG